VLIVNKLDSAPVAGVQQVMHNIAQLNPTAMVIQARSAVSVGRPELIRGKRVLVIEDGPTLTHGEMGYGSGVVAAQRYGAAEIVDPRPFVQGGLVETFQQAPWITQALPAMGYSPHQLQDLAATVAAVGCDTIVVATPVDLTHLIPLPHPCCRVQYELEEIGHPDLAHVVGNFLRERGL
jgi:predicted GTPase